MNNNEHDNKLEQRIRFVAKRYREGSLDPDKAWQKFASEHVISRKVSFRRYWIGAAAVVLVLVGLGTWFTVERNAPGLGCDYYRPRTNERCLPSG